MFKKLEEEFKIKENATALEEHKRALQQVRDMKRQVNQTEIN